MESFDEGSGIGVRPGASRGRGRRGEPLIDLTDSSDSLHVVGAAAGRSGRHPVDGLAGRSVAEPVLVRAVAAVLMLLAAATAAVSLAQVGAVGEAVAGAVLVAGIVAAGLAMWSAWQRAQHLTDPERQLTHQERRIADLQWRASRAERILRAGRALDMASDERQVWTQLERVVEDLDGRRPVELLMAARGSGELKRVMTAGLPDRLACPVASLGDCPAATAASVRQWTTSRAPDACRHLRGRDGGSCSAVCVPVSVDGRSVGVFHSVGDEGRPPEVCDELTVLSHEVGRRLSEVRAVATLRDQRDTDDLTGLPRRGVVNREIQELLDAGRQFVLVFADLDEFTKLNDDFGHLGGDRGLGVYASVLSSSVREGDLVGRWGGEEFLLVYPDTSPREAEHVLFRLRRQLAEAMPVDTAGLRTATGTGEMRFTCSYGFTHSSEGRTVDELTGIANAAMKKAKWCGRDEIVYFDSEQARRWTEQEKRRKSDDGSS